MEFNDMERHEVLHKLRNIAPYETEQVEQVIKWYDKDDMVISQDTLHMTPKELSTFIDIFDDHLEAATETGYSGETSLPGSRYHIWKTWKCGTGDGVMPGAAKVCIEYTSKYKFRDLISYMSDVMRAADRLYEIERDRCGDVAHDEAAEDIKAIAEALGNIRAHEHSRREIEMRHERQNDGVCRHGTYVGGCGIDWMCGPCEMDDDC